MGRGRVVTLADTIDWDWIEPVRPRKDKVSLTDRTVGRWTVGVSLGYKRMPCGAIEEYYECTCACGVVGVVGRAVLVKETSTSCGCFRTEENAKRCTTHGESRSTKNTPEYRAWSKMWWRCTNEKATTYHLYGARGIRVCARWKKYENFLADMGRRPSTGHSLDRIDTNGNYAPKNLSVVHAARTDEQCAVQHKVHMARPKHDDRGVGARVRTEVPHATEPTTQAEVVHRGGDVAATAAELSLETLILHTARTTA